MPRLKGSDYIGDRVWVTKNKGCKTAELYLGHLTDCDHCPFTDCRDGLGRTISRQGQVSLEHWREKLRKNGVTVE